MRGRRLTRSIIGTAALAAAACFAPSASAATPGELTQLAGTAGCISEDGTGGACTSGMPAANNGRQLAISPDGENVYFVSSGSSSLITLDRDIVTGALTAKAGTAGCIAETATASCEAGRALFSPRDVAVSPDGLNVYVASNGSDALAIFDRDPGTGELTQKADTAGCIVHPPSSIPTCDNTGRALSSGNGITVSPDGNNVYLVGAGGGHMAVFDRADDGTLTQKAGSAGCVADNPSGQTATCADGFALGNLEAVAVSPDGISLYVTADSTEAVSVFDRDPANGAVSQKLGTAGCVAETSVLCQDGRGLTDPRELAVSGDGSNVYVASGSVTNGGVAILDRAANGELAPRNGTQGCISETGSGGECDVGRGLALSPGIAISRDDRTVYVSGENSAAVAVFDRAPSSGSLVQKPGTAGCVSENGGEGCASGHELFGARSVVVSPDDGFVYSMSSVIPAVAAFKREALPVCQDAFRTVFNSTPRTVPLSCSDANGDAITLSIVTGPANGTLGTIDQGAGTVAYTPNAGFTGNDAFTYKATSAGTDSDVATITLEVLPPAPPSPPGPPGPPQTQIQRALFAALIDNALRVRRRRAFAIRYLSTTEGQATLEIKRGARTLIELEDNDVEQGRNRFRISRRQARRLGRRAYGSELTVTSSDGQTATDTGRIRVR